MITNPAIPVSEQEKAIQKYCKEKCFTIIRTLSILTDDEYAVWDILEKLAAIMIKDQANIVVVYSQTMLSKEPANVKEIIRIFNHCMGLQFKFVLKAGFTLNKTQKNTR